MFAVMGLGTMEILLLACVGLPMFLATIVVLLATIRYLSRPTGQRQYAVAAPQPVVSALSHQDVLRTRFFVHAPVNATHTCPRCHAALAPDAPEGLCPACLLAGGLEGNSLPPTSSGHGTPSGAGAVDAAALAAAFPNLEIVELLGQGGMGTVFKVRQKNLDRLAALKVIPPQAALDPTFSERFAREARALARLNHSSIVTVYDFGQLGGFYFLLMEYVDGPNLRQLMRSERIAPREALAIVPQICDALQYAHDQGIVHRDIKPENVLLDRTGRVKIADFGLAKLLGTSPADFTLTNTQQVMGTPRYMAPEQIEHPTNVDHRADIYSLGVVIYEMLTGELPIGRFAPPSQKVEVDVRLDEIVLRTLEKEPQRRYQQVSQVKTELENVSSLPAAPVINAAAVPEMAATAMRWEPDSTKPGPSVGLILTIVGMILGFVMMGIGVGLLGTSVVALMSFPNQEEGAAYLFGWGIAVLLAGTFWFLRSWHKYRQSADAVDLFHAPYVTWFDQVLRVCCVLGLIAAACGLVFALQVFSWKLQQMPFGVVEDIEVWSTLLVVGTVAALQSGVALLWRQAAQQRAFAADVKASAGSAAGSSLSVRPGFLLAVVVPTLAIAAVWGLVLLDMHFMTSHWPQKRDHILSLAPGGVRMIASVTGVSQRDAAIHQLWIAAAVTLAAVFAGLSLWRAIGPRRMIGDMPSSLAVTPPFGHPIWAAAIIVLSFATFVMPWVRLHFDAIVREPDFKVQLIPGTYYYGDTLRQIAGMPQGERFVALGFRNLGGAAAAVMAGVGAILAVGIASGQSRIIRVQAGIGIAAGVLAVMILVAFAHQLGERDESLIMDAITQRGLSRSISGSDIGPGSGPALVLQDFVNVSPALGFYVAATAAGLLILKSATQWSWSAALPESAPAALKSPVDPLPAKVTVDDGRQSALAQVRGPGMGLIVSGVLGLAPIVLFCVAIPLSWAVLLPVKTDEFRLEPETTYKNTTALMRHVPVANVGILQPPVVLAQEAPPMQVGAAPTWGLLMLIVAGIALLVTLPSSILLILGGMKMRQLQSYGLVNFAAIIALLPLGPQWLISLPMGIWALAVLGKPEVKAAFR